MARTKQPTTSSSAAAEPSEPAPAEKKVESSTTTAAASNPLFGWVWFGVVVYLFGVIMKTAYRIRMGAIDEFGPVIHEFDPYFNYRATEVSNAALA